MAIIHRFERVVSAYYTNNAIGLTRDATFADNNVLLLMPKTDFKNIILPLSSSKTM